MSRQTDIAWAAGLFEGEGCFTSRTNSSGRYPSAALVMTDEDRVRRFADIVGTGRVRPRGTAGGNLDQFVWVASSFEHVQAVVALLWHQLGPRRRERASEVLRNATFHPGYCSRGHEFAVTGRPCRECIKIKRAERHVSAKPSITGWI